MDDFEKTVIDLRGDILELVFEYFDADRIDSFATKTLRDRLHVILERGLGEYLNDYDTGYETGRDEGFREGKEEAWHKYRDKLRDVRDYVEELLD